MATRWLRRTARSVPWWPAWMVVAAAVTTMVAARPAGALDDEPSEPLPVLGCLSKVKGWMAGVTQVTFGQSTTVSWGVTVPSGCTGVTVQATGPGLVSTARSGSQAVVPIPAANGYAHYQVRAVRNGLVHPVANWAIKVAPVSWTAYGRTFVQITDSRQNAAFVEAIATPNTTVVLADHVELDLSGRHFLPIKPGVHILGGRSSTTPGPRVFTTTSPGELFVIGGHFEGTAERRPADNVRISGIRLDGGQMGIASGDGGSKGIAVRNSVNVEIGNNEIYGWSGAGVEVRDDEAMPHRLNLENASAVWIHDNAIHHNRHWGTLGYGVVTHAAYALIERNVFDYNRHALAASGAIGTGYLAYHNLVLPGGGENFDYWLGIQYTHQFDVHGTEEDLWGRDAYEGDAGQYFDYRYNTLWYSAGTPIKVRGIPAYGADVTQNIFYTDAEPVVQTEGDNVIVWENIRAYATGRPQGFVACDFDGDGRADPFLATGVTWWYQSVTGQWHYLNTSRTMGWELTFQDFDLDGRCDVKENAAQRIFSGGRATLLVAHAEVAAQRTDLVWMHAGSGGEARVWQLDPVLGAVARDVTVTFTKPGLFPDGGQLLGTGDFNADGAPDLLWRYDDYVYVSLKDADGQAVAPGHDVVHGGIPDDTPWPLSAGTIALSTQLAGIGDFNADGRADLLWRHADGTLEIWFAGEQGNRVKPSWSNVLPPLEEPVSLDWQVKGVADFNGDGYSDILWFSDAAQKVAIWYMEHSVHIGDGYPGGALVAAGWQIQGVGDFDADGAADILWRHAEGNLVLWFRGLYQYGQAAPTWQNWPGHLTGPEWQVEGIGDFNADGRADILWRHDDGTVSIWKMNGGWYIGESALLPMDPAWQLRGLLPQAPHRLDLQ